MFKPRRPCAGGTPGSPENRTSAAGGFSRSVPDRRTRGVTLQVRLGGTPSPTGNAPVRGERQRWDYGVAVDDWGTPENSKAGWETRPS